MDGGRRYEFPSKGVTSILTQEGGDVWDRLSEKGVTFEVPYRVSGAKTDGDGEWCQGREGR